MKIFRLVASAATVSALDCFDGNNGGCSHLCTSGGCECPECWELDEFDSFNCKIQAGMATVTCSSTGTEILLNKCVAPDVEPDKINLNEPACHAVDFDDEHYRIATPSATSCGAMLHETEGVLHYEYITDFGMKVKSCVIFDSANQDLKIDLIEDFCPNDLGLDFHWGATNGNHVNFMYTSFAFPDSSADATMIVECDVELCNDEVCEQGCPLIPTSDSDSEMDVLGS
ncbi:Oidioi.mRNA.OKI2018_I69.chr1.g508.t1.cds [Oikopleura dioica]|uniref:Oidioi.mRNA.OKI2018_I69.chr1.g508.t1.cds n=1 Tax=Oikopleura dioica TaxID=34765 RepID=A0ABN7SKK4_OIKDI|nr:Oidioi.mRNA.OKI2018_I69.chr1.g508.t1.cds [Oikopleura dioica]